MSEVFLSVAFYQIYLLGTATGILLGYFILTKDIVRKYFQMRDNVGYTESHKWENDKK